MPAISIERFRVTPGACVDLKEVDSVLQNQHEGNKETAEEIARYPQG